MALVKLEDFYPDYREDSFELDEIKGFDVYAASHEKVGSLSDILVDEDTGKFRYFVVDTGFWVFGKKVLLPVGLADILYTEKEIYARNLTKQQVENLPNFDQLEKVDYDYEESVRGVYRGSVDTSDIRQPVNYDRNTYNYDHEPSLYNINDQNQGSLKLYEERLIANKKRRKTGEVKVGKHVETETARVAVPVEKEHVVIERVDPTDRTISNPQNAFQEGEVARVEIYEEAADISKEAVLREEVRVNKVVDTETVEASEKVRREELDIDSKDLPIVDKGNR